MIKIKYNVYEVFLLFVLIPFMVPRGFLEYFSLYKLFFTIWLLISALLIFGFFLFRLSFKRISCKSCIWLVFFYYIYFIADSFALQGRINEGLQKLFIAPALFVLCAMFLNDRPISFIRTISNIVIINFSLNITIFNPYLWPKYFNVDNHIVFLGHVQTCSQLGLLGIFLAYLLRLLKEKRKAQLLFFLSIVNMFISATSASYLSLGLLLFFFFFTKIKKNCKIPIKTEVLLGIYIVFNLFLYLIINRFKDGSFDSFLTLVTSGRTIIWREAFKMMNGHWLFGYGVYGVLIKVFWSDGMNYAHNEMMQRLLDGGLILSILFIILLYAYVNKVKDCDNKKMVFWSYIILFTMFVVMLFESVTEYYYFSILISMMAYLPKVEAEIDRRLVNEYKN